MAITNKKRIRKTSDVTALPTGTIVDSLDSNSTTDAPSIRVVKDINTRVNSLETNGVAVGDTLPIESQVYFDGTEDEIPEGYVKVDPPFSNNNLLINGDFRNPVNQRSQTNYWKPSSWSYSIDRWAHIWNSVILENGCIKVYNDTGETGTTYFKQIFEHSLEQGDYTITVNVKEITGTVNVEGFSTLTQGLNVFTVKNKSLAQVQLNLVGESSIYLYWIKLEVGSIATPFSPRPYAEEYAMCQRYYQTLGENTAIIKRADIVHTSINIDIILDCKMRATPTVVDSYIQAVTLDNMNWLASGGFTALNNQVMRAYGNIDQDCLLHIKDVRLDAEIY